MSVIEPDVFDFDTSLKQKPVRLNGKSYVLTEATEAASIAYRNQAIKGARVAHGEVSGMPTDMGSVQAVLVGHCLFPTNGNGELTLNGDGQPSALPLGPAKVKQLPGRIVRPMFDWVKDNSPGLDEQETLDDLRKQRDKIVSRIAELESNDGEDEAKNSPSDTTT